MVFVAADHQIDLVLIEQRQPFLADAEVGAVGAVSGGDRRLMHADNHPVDIRVAPRRGEFACKPALLLPARVTVHVEVAAVLEGDIVVVECKGDVETKAGNRYDDDYCYVCQFADDGKLVALTEYMDTALAERVLAAPV